MAEGLKIIVGADITDAQAKLKKVVVDAKTAGKQVEKSFGNARLPLGDIKAYTAAIQNIKQNVSGVSFTQLNDGIAQSGSAAGAAIGKIGGLAASLAQGALAGVVLVAAHALVGLVKSLFDTGDAAEKSEAALKKYEDQLSAVKDNVKGLGEELQFLNELAAINAKIFKLPEVLKLSGESVKQRQLTADLEDERLKLLVIQQKITDDTELSGDDRVKAEKKAADDIIDIDERLRKSKEKQTLIYRAIANQRVDDTDKAHEKELANTDRFISETIAKAKEIASFLKDSFVITYRFSPLEDRATQFQNAKSFLDDVFGDRLKVKLQFQIDPQDIGLPTESEMKHLLTPMEELLKGGIVLPKAVDPSGGFLNPESVKLFEKNIKVINDLGFSILDLPELDIFKFDQQDYDNVIAGLQRIKAESAFVASTVNGLLTPAFDGLFEAIKSGENPLKAFFEGLGQAVLQLIQKLIQAAITAAILSAILPGGGGGFSALFGKFLGMASGGLVSGPTLAAVGEGSGTSLSNPEVVAPLDQLKSLLGDIGGGGTQVVVMRTQVSGNNLLLVQARTSRRNKRLGARA